MSIKKRINLTVLCALIFLIPVCYAISTINNSSVGSVNSSTIIDKEDFENGFSSYWYRAMNNYTYSGTISENNSFSPTHSYRFELRKGDASFEDGIRSELESRAEPPLQERWYNFSVFLPNSTTEDYAHDYRNCGEVIMQFHNNPDKGEEWTRPPLAIFTDTYSNGTGEYYVQTLWDSDPISTDEKLNSEGKVKEYVLGSYDGDKGRWVKWAFHIKWGWLPEHNAFVRIYKDGKLFFSKDGPDTTNDQKGINQQFGIYKWEWNGQYSGQNSKLTKRVIYFDDVSVEQVDNSTSTNNSISTNNTNIETPVPILPTCNFSITPKTFSFVDTSANTTSRKWNFGDGYTSTSKSTTHSYNPGVYTVTLTAINANGTVVKSYKLNALATAV
jgi:hypothetical protein